MYRACLAVYGQSPHQLEVAIIRELLNEAEDGDSSLNEAAEMTLIEIENLINEVQVYTDQDTIGD